MFESLNGVDWDLLYRQKLTLLELRQRQSQGSAEADALSGVIHLLNTLQDDEGHHHGPMDDYEEAAGVADAIHGRIIVQETERSLASSQDEDPKGGA